MTFDISQHCVNLFYRKLGFPRSLVYSCASRLKSILPSSTHSSNSIDPYKTYSSVEPISEFLAYKRFSLNELNFSDLIITECLKIFAQNKNKYGEDYFIKNPNKRFLLTVDSDESLLKNQQIRNFIASEKIHYFVSEYLQHPYVLSTIRLWWTPVNSTVESSQKYHLDDEDLTQIKLFLNITDVAADHGPFTFLPADTSLIVLNKHRNPKRRYTDEEIAETLGSRRQISLTGKAGNGAFVDTSKCLHYGSRQNQKDRLILMAQFLKSNSPILKQSLSIS